MVTKEQIVRWLELTTEVLTENKDYLTQLDADIGDADHGTNMDRGFRKVAEKLPTVADKDIGNILKTVGMTLISRVGGASGPLYGTFFQRGWMAADAKEELSDEDLVVMLQGAVVCVQARGRAQPGDKIMMDALLPAMAALKASVADGKGSLGAMEDAVAAAEQGMKDTIPLQARKGRASYLGERSIGHQDPGATSSHLILNALLTALKE